ncbi:MAG: tetratricopeptide repeat protein, partial [Bacteroidales bacterium]|nr:tetratricopeptide repeat protein [Bacteroidales bacterium]
TMKELRNSLLHNFFYLIKRMIRRYFIKFFFIFLFFLSGYDSISQTNPDFKTIDSVSYDLFLKGAWKELVLFGNSAIESGTDYYYLRMRTGVAYYNKKNYRKAIEHFEKALEFNSGDVFASEYLYYSYLLSGREMDSKHLSEYFPDSLKTKLDVKKSDFIDNIYIEYGNKYSNNNSLNSKIDIDGKENIYGEFMRSNEQKYYNVGLKHYLSGDISVFHGFSFINILQSKQIRFNNIDSVYTDNSYQKGYYLSGNFLLSKGLILSPAFHYIFYEYTTIYTDKIPGKKISKRYKTFNNYLGYIGITKEFTLNSFGAFCTYSDLNSGNQLQIGCSLAFYPLGNYNLYSNTSVVNCTQNNRSKFVADQTIGFKVFSKLWLSGFVTYGNFINYNEKNGSVIYNVPDLIKYKYGASVLMPLTKNIELLIFYQYFMMQANYITFINPRNSIINNLSYQNQSIIGGIKWKF